MSKIEREPITEPHPREVQMARNPQSRAQFTPASAAPADPLSESYRALVESFRRKLLAENKSPRTVQTYGEGLRLFGEFLEAHGMPLTLAHIRREHVEAFTTHLLTRYRPATASNRTWQGVYRAPRRLIVSFINSHPIESYVCGWRIVMLTLRTPSAASSCHSIAS